MSPQDVLAVRSYAATRKVSYDDAAYEREREQCERERAAGANGENGNGVVIQERYCWCNECIVNGKLYPMVKGHDCEYVRRRSQLVDKAYKSAMKKVGGNGCGHRFAREFAKIMERLAKPLLNQSENGSA